MNGSGLAAQDQVVSSTMHGSTVVHGRANYAWLKTINSFNATYTMPIIIVSGIGCNLLALLVFTCSPLRRRTVSVYLAALSLADFVFLVFLGLGWLDSLQITIFASSGLCQVMVFFTYVVSFLSLWLIVTFTAELYFSIHCTHLHNKISRPKRAVAVAGVLVIVACCIYMFSFWLTRLVRISDTEVFCHFTGSNTVAIAVSVVDFLLTLILPFSLLIFMDVRILYTVAKVSKEKAKRVPGSAPCAQGNSKTKPRQHLRQGHKLASRCKGCGYNSSAGDRAKCADAQKRLQSCKANQKSTWEILPRLPDNEIKFFNSKGQMFSVEKLIVKDFGLGVTVERFTDIIMDEALHRRDVNRFRFHMHRGSLPPVLEESPRRPLLVQGLPCQNSFRITSSTQGKTLSTLRGGAGEKPQRPKSMISSYNTTLDGNKRSRLDISESSSSSQPNPRSIISNTTKNRASEAKRRSTANDKRSRKVSISEDTIVLEQMLPQTDVRDRSHKKEHSLNPLTKLQRICYKMVIAVALVFLILNLPCHLIRLQGLLRSTFSDSYITSELEVNLQQLLQTIYYLNFVVNIITYSACDKSFRIVFVQLPWHVTRSMKSAFRTCVPVEKKSARARQQQIRDNEEHSRLVEICLPELHLSDIPSFAPDYKHASPPCLLQLEPH